MPLELNDFETATLRRLFDAQQDDEYVSLEGLSNLLLEAAAAERGGVEIPQEERKGHARRWIVQISAQIQENVGEALHPELKIRKPARCGHCGKVVLKGRSNAYFYEPDQ